MRYQVFKTEPEVVRPRITCDEAWLLPLGTRVRTNGNASTTDTHRTLTGVIGYINGGNLYVFHDSPDHTGGSRPYEVWRNMTPEQRFHMPQSWVVYKNSGAWFEVL